MPDVDVAIVIPALGRNGGLRVLIEWANRLASSGRRVAVVAAARGDGQRLDESICLRAPGRAEHFVDEVAVRALRKAVASYADLAVYPRAARRHLPTAKRYILGFAPWADSLDLPSGVLTYCQHWEPLWFEDSGRAQAVADRAMRRPGPKIVNSTWLKAHWAEKDQNSLHLVHPGVDLDVFHPGPHTARAAERPLRVASLGREDVPWKGLTELRKAVASQPEPVDLLLFGTPTTETVIRPWGRERHLGGLASQELAKVYRSVDVVVTPSWFESFPLPPLEAMACGTPVITTREGTEDYAEDGVNAVVVPGRDVPALTNAIQRLARDRDLQTRLRLAGPETARRFTWARGYSMFEAAFEGTG